MRKQRKPIYAHDDDQQEIVLITLANHPEPAKILKEDFTTLTTAGFSANWTFNDNGEGNQYVRCNNAIQKNLSSVARLILNPPPGRIVKYLDGDRLNLRRDNLVLARRNQKRSSQRSRN